MDLPDDGADDRADDRAEGAAGESGGRLRHGSRLDVIGLAVGLVVVAITTAATVGHHVSDAEARVFRWVNRLPGWVGPPLVVVMQAGTLVAVLVATVAAMVLRRARLALELAVAGILTWSLARLLKILVGRGRPVAFFADVIVRGTPAAGHGYPSGHTSTAAALAMTATPWLPTWAVWAGWATVAIVAVARLYVGAHLPIDVIGGAALGVSVGAAVHLVLGTPERSGPS